MTRPVTVDSLLEQARSEIDGGRGPAAEWLIREAVRVALTQHRRGPLEGRAQLEAGVRDAAEALGALAADLRRGGGA